MTLARLKATGSGSLRFRVAIEGIGISPVTHSDMEQASDGDGRRRVASLIMSGFRRAERSDPLHADLEVDNIRLSFTDVGEYATSVFAAVPTRVTYLTAQCTAAATSASVLSTASFSTAGTIYLDAERMTYTGKTSTTFTGMSRGTLGTLPAWHYVTDGGRLRNPEVTDQPVQINGRRVFVYAYGTGDDPQGDGTQVWIGIAVGEPAMQGGVWSMSAKSVVSVLDQEIGADLGTGNLHPRGIHFRPNAPFRLWVKHLTIGGGSNLYEIQLPNALNTTVHWETQRAFVSDVNAELALAFAGDPGSSTLQCIEYDGAYAFQLVCDGTYLRYVATEAGQPAPRETEPTFGLPLDTDGNPFDPGAATAGAYVQIPTGGAAALPGSVPRGYNLNSSPPPVGAPWAEADVAITLYLDGAVTSNANAAIIETDELTGHAEITVSTSDNSITASAAELGFYGTPLAWTADNPPTVRLVRSYDSADSPTGNSLYNLLQALRIGSAQYAGLGAQPVIRASDFDLSGWSVLSNPGQPSSVRNRSYLIARPIKLRDIVLPELQLAGYYLALNSSGAMTVKRLRLATAAETTTFAISKSNLFTDDAFPTFERSPLGQINRVVIRDGYDAILDDYTEPDIVLRDVRAFARDPYSRSVAIEPKSALLTGPLRADEAVAVASALTGIFGQPYRIVTCELSLTAWDVLAGDAVSINTKHIPGAGVRGTTSATGIVIGRELRPYEARTGLTLLVSEGTVAAYASSSLVASQANVSGNTWDITLAGDEFPGSTQAEDWFTVGDPVVVTEFDSEAPATATGGVDSVTGDVVRVTFTGVWTPGSAEWLLEWANADSGSTTTSMRKYAWLAGADGIVDFDPNPDADAYRLAP